MEPLRDRQTAPMTHGERWGTARKAHQPCLMPTNLFPAPLQSKHRFGKPGACGPTSQIRSKSTGQPAQLLQASGITGWGSFPRSQWMDTVDGPTIPHSSQLPVPNRFLFSPLPVGRGAPSPAHLLHFPRDSLDDPIPHTRWEIACTFRMVISGFVFFPKRSC